jgi:translocation and assembly module TamA
LLITPGSFAAWEITGTPRAITSIVRDYLTEAELPCGDDNESTAEIKRSVRDALDALGYFAATSTVQTQEDNTCLVNISLGTRVKINSWQTEFENATSTTPAIVTALALTESKNLLLDPQLYAQKREGFINTLKDSGYIDAQFTFTDVAVDLETATADIRWRVNAGEQYVIQPLIIEQTILEPELVQRFLTFTEGSVLNNQQLVESYENLLSSDYYARVRVTPLVERRSQGTVPVRVTAAAANKWSYLVGPGFSTDSGPRFRAEANARYLNKKGHRTSFTSLVSPVTGYVKANYRWPFGNPNHEWYSIESRFDYEDTDTAISKTAALGLRRTTRLSKHWAQTTYLDYSIEQFDISNQEGRSQLLILGSNFTYTSSINAPRPRIGRRLSLDIRGAQDTLLSDNSLLQLRLQGKQILPFLGNSRLLLRAQLGFSWQDEFEDLPASLRFFTGGDKSVRGYALESLGPLDDTGEVEGGDRLMVASAEIDMPLRKNWSFALFTDVGSAYRDTPEFSQSVGLGLRWYSPLGPIRVDLAHPLDDSDQVVRVHISLGPDI